LEMLRHAADVTAWGELIGLQRQRASEELQAIFDAVLKFLEIAGK
jgi:hypothetical protein